MEDKKTPFHLGMVSHELKKKWADLKLILSFNEGIQQTNEQMLQVLLDAAEPVLLKQHDSKMKKASKGTVL